MATGLTYRRALRELAAFFELAPTEDAVYTYRLSRDPEEYASALLRATGTEWLLVDDGFPPPKESVEWEELGRLAACRALPILRLETRGAAAAQETATARERGFVALKSIAAYRGGLDRVSEDVVAALAANEATGAPLPVQFRCGFGDSDLWLARSDPSHLKSVDRAVPRDAVRAAALIYPFTREAG